MSRSDLINVQELLDSTNNGLDIYQQELNLVRKGYNYVGLCPFHNEKTPSFSVSNKGLFKCFGCEESGNIFGFLMLRYGLTYKQALERVKESCNFTTLTSKKPINVIKNQQKEKLLVEWNRIPFTQQAKDYWEAYSLPEDFLVSKNVFQIDLYALNKRTYRVKEKQATFVYYAPDLKESKFLTIGEGVSKDEKWKSYNIPNNYLWYLHEYKENSCEDLFICKSVKDSLVLSKLGYCTISVQSESEKILISNKDRIEPVCKHPYIVFGSDIQGKTASLEANKVLNWRYFNTKNYLLKEGINDPAEFVKEFSLQLLDKQVKKDLKKWKIN